MAQNSAKSAVPGTASPDLQNAISPDSFAQLDREKFTQNMLKVGAQTQQLLAGYFKRMANQDRSGPLDPLNVSGAFLALVKAMGEDRETVLHGQLQLWKDWMGLWETTARRILGG